MEKRKIIQNIRELDRSARFDSLVNSSQEDLEYHLELLLRRTKLSAGRPARQAQPTVPTIPARSAA